MSGMMRPVPMSKWVRDGMLHIVMNTADLVDSPGVVMVLFRVLPLYASVAPLLAIPLTEWEEKYQPAPPEKVLPEVPVPTPHN